MEQFMLFGKAEQCVTLAVCVGLFFLIRWQFVLMCGGSGTGHLESQYTVLQHDHAFAEPYHIWICGNPTRFQQVNHAYMLCIFAMHITLGHTHMAYTSIVHVTAAHA